MLAGSSIDAIRHADTDQCGTNSSFVLRGILCGMPRKRSRNRPSDGGGSYSRSAAAPRPQAGARSLAGAIYHGTGALEAVAPDLAGDPKATLGEAVRRNPKLLPKPLDTALSQLWGYARLNEARHVKETEREDAGLVVGLAAVATYLTKK
jgi:hypothetical protein